MRSSDDNNNQEAQDDRWEHGSDFHYPSSLSPSSEPRWHPPSASYWHSGRDALRALIQATKPRRVLFPSFYCQDVYSAATGYEAVAYADGPTDTDNSIADPSSFLRAGDLIVVTNTYGLRSRSPLLSSPPADVIVVEDHTHDPTSAWAKTSKATYAFASLRKWFPIPDGGVLWSPLQKREPIESPAELSDECTAVTLDRLSGMLLKARFLIGENADKPGFRALSVRGEEHIGQSLEPQPMSSIARALFDLFPADAWRATRRKNHDTFVAACDSSVRILSKTSDLASASTSVTPYCVVLEFESHDAREAMRSHLVKQRIYPAVLWPLDGKLLPGIPDAHVDLSRRTLCLHCDHRYAETDMLRVAAAVASSFER
jgi:hypothetical protein